MERIIKLHRFKQDENQTLGRISIFDGDLNLLFTSLSLERGWRNNEQGVSCVPKNIYPLELEYSNRFKTDLWEIKDVPNRSECKFHSSNYWYQLEGCIAMGIRATDMNNDGYMDVTSSKGTLKELMVSMSPLKIATLVITSEDNIN